MGLVDKIHMVFHNIRISSIQLLGHVQLFVTPWTAACQAFLSIISQSLLKLTPIELVMLSNHLILSPPSPPAFSLHQHQGLSKDSVICIRWPKHCSFSFSIILPTNIQDWFPLRLIGWISFQSKGLSRVFSNTTVQKHQFFALSFLYSPRLTSIDNHWKNHSFD